MKPTTYRVRDDMQGVYLGAFVAIAVLALLGFKYQVQRVPSSVYHARVPPQPVPLPVGEGECPEPHA